MHPVRSSPSFANDWGSPDYLGGRSTSPQQHTSQTAAGQGLPRPAGGGSVVGVSQRPKYHHHRSISDGGSGKGGSGRQQARSAELFFTPETNGEGPATNSGSIVGRGQRESAAIGGHNGNRSDSHSLTSSDNRLRSSSPTGAPLVGALKGSRTRHEFAEKPRVSFFEPAHGASGGSNSHVSAPLPRPGSKVPHFHSTAQESSVFLIRDDLDEDEDSDVAGQGGGLTRPTTPSRMDTPLLLLNVDIGKYSQPVQFAITAGGTLLFYIIYAYIQEWVFAIPGFSFSWVVTGLQFLSFLTFSYAERAVHYWQLGAADREQLTQSRAEYGVPFKSYLTMAFLLLLSFGLSNMSLLHLSYPTKVIMKASKLIPVMVLGLAVQGKSYGRHEYVSALLLIAGLALFTLGPAAGSLGSSSSSSASESSVGRSSSDMLGFLVMSGSLVADSVLGNMQEHSMAAYHCSPQDLVFYNSAIAFLMVSAFTAVSGELRRAILFFEETPTAFVTLLALVSFGYLGVCFYLALVKCAGIFVAVVVATVRKFSTILLSFLLFPKPFTVSHLVGIVLVFAGISLNSVRKAGAAAGGIQSAPKKVSNSDDSKERYSSSLFDGAGGLNDDEYRCSSPPPGVVNTEECPTLMASPLVGSASSTFFVPHSEKQQQYHQHHQHPLMVRLDQLDHKVL